LGDLKQTRNTEIKEIMVNVTTYFNITHKKTESPKPKWRNTEVSVVLRTFMIVMKNDTQVEVMAHVSSINNSMCMK